MRKITKIRKSVKAISPIIATLLLIAIAVVAALVVYAWVMGYIGVNTSKSGQALQIQSYTSGVDNKHVVIYVQNVGQGTAQLPASGSVYINNQMAPIASSVSIGPGQTATIIADLSQTTLTWTVGQQITVKVVASGGTFTQTTGYGTAGSGGTGGSSGATITLGSSSGSAGSPVSLSGSGFAHSSTLTVTVGTLSGVTTSPTTITSDTSGAIPSGTTFTIPSGTAAGLYTVTVTDASSNTASQSFQVTALTQYTVTVTQTANGVIAPGTGSYSAGQSFTITPNTNYQIASITVNGNPVTVTTPAGQTYTFTTLTAPATITATYSAVATQYTITVTQTSNGQISPGTGSYSAGQSFTITPSSGYHIASITANGASVTVTTPAGQTYTFTTLTGAATLTATYASNTFGYTTQGTSTSDGNLENYILGSRFTSPAYSVTAQSITAYIQVSGTHTIKAAIYTSGGTLVASTQEVSVTTSNDGWVTFAFASGSQPTLTASTNYYLVVWGNSASGDATLYYTSTGGNGVYDQRTYGTWPTTDNWDGTLSHIYSIYCTYTVP